MKSVSSRDLEAIASMTRRRKDYATQLGILNRRDRPEFVRVQLEYPMRDYATRKRPGDEADMIVLDGEPELDVLRTLMRTYFERQIKEIDAALAGYGLQVTP
ncbi:hypothetical protein [Methylobacterium sp. AMS5]|uniref:hypothetical protein n=1 Tax=Methylobacterium sp. AMS5 TaxID=925818 RepID=UPI00074F8526|nr:hypothetical protein [Methylobacterium sp. AMS5]AMB48356.1 hypothetical protein Y590_25645 [Methylobacterium sp. AMS5]